MPRGGAGRGGYNRLARDSISGLASLSGRDVCHTVVLPLPLSDAPGREIVAGGDCGGCESPGLCGQIGI